MDIPSGELQVFSAILVQQYIRLMTAAVYHKSEKNIRETKFKISPENYRAMKNDPSQTSLLGLALEYNEDKGILKVQPDDEFFEEFENNIMHDVALKYYEYNKTRYASYILLIEE